MLCDSCKERDAVVHVTQIQGSAVTQLNLCEKCAADRGVDTPSAMPKHPLGEFLHAVQQQVTVPSSDGVKCRSEEHTSELQSRQYLVCRLLLEKKKKHKFYTSTITY